MPRKAKGPGDGGSAAQKRGHAPLPDAVHATKKSSTPIASDRTSDMYEHSLWQHVTHARHPVPYIESCHATAFQVIAKLEMLSITCVHIAQKETVSVHAALEKPFRPEMMKGILKVWTHRWWRACIDLYIHRWWRACIDLYIQTCQSLIELSHISVRYSTQGSRTTTCGQRASTCRMHSYAQSVYSFARLYDRNTDILLVFQPKVQPLMGLAAVPWRRWRWNDRGGLRGSISCGWGSVWETDGSYQCDEWLYKFTQEGIFKYWDGRLPGHAHVN